MARPTVVQSSKRTFTTAWRCHMFVKRLNIRSSQSKLCSLRQLKDLNRANDPSAGSPTETLLRLLLPLSDKV